MAHMEGAVTIATGILHLRAIPADTKRSACIHSLHICAQTLTNSKPSAFSPPEADRTWGIEGLGYGDLILEGVISTNPKRVAVKITVPFGVPIRIRHLIFRVPKKGP